MRRQVRLSLSPKFQSCYLILCLEPPFSIVMKPSASSPFVFRSRTERRDCTNCSCFTYHTFLFSFHLCSVPLFVLLPFAQGSFTTI
ncbi:hypothetical protein BGW80DRAFT_1337972 [Lactifluus volemus]|nr:hypothetical protein BGW80DRAFT_1337972 [Lactifluus volemus]